MPPTASNVISTVNSVPARPSVLIAEWATIFFRTIVAGCVQATAKHVQIAFPALRVSTLPCITTRAIHDASHPLFRIAIFL